MNLVRQNNTQAAPVMSGKSAMSAMSATSAALTVSARTAVANVCTPTICMHTK